VERFFVRYTHLSIEEFRSNAARYNALWRASRVSIPTARAEHVLHWAESFLGGKQSLSAVVVEDAGEWVAALPVIDRRGGLLRVVDLPTNPWQPSGELLLDESADVKRAIETLVDGLQSLRRSIFDFSIILPQTGRWQSFLRTLERQGIGYSVAPRFDVGLMDVCTDWKSQSGWWSANHRRRVKRNQKLVNDSPELSFDFHQLNGSAESAGVLDALWRLEVKSWKGEQGDAVLNNPDLVQFYRLQASLMSTTDANDVSAHVAILRHQAKPIAAIYYWIAKEVCHLWKTAYDPAAAEWSPGSLLLQEVLRRGVGTQGCRLFNFMGPMSGAHASWATRRFEVGRLVFHGRSGAGRAAVKLYGAIRRLQGRATWKLGDICEAAPIDAPAPEAVCR
jgi:CelD/BcsL family acetyltransferase involved in cellulose biosynthesis